MFAGIPKFGLAIVKEGFVLDNVVAIRLATRSVLCRMLTAGVATLPRSRLAESVCYIIILIHSYTNYTHYYNRTFNKVLVYDKHAKYAHLTKSTLVWFM